ncbi:conjugal transfer protein TraG N-terminal domain-containing protein, partial [Hydrogenovibrio marinus]
IVAGSKAASVIRNYLVVLGSIQLWAPMFAITNYFINSFRQSQFLAQVNPTDAISVMQSQLISSGAQSDLDIAGMLVMSIPVLALALAKGGEMALTSFISGAMAPAQQAASRAAQEVAMGNLSMGNVSADNHSFRTTTALNYDMQPNTNMGANTRMDQSGVRTTVNNDGNVSKDTTAIESKGALVNYTASSAQTQQAKNSYETAHKATQSAETEAAYNAAQISSHLNSAGTGFDVSKAVSNSHSVTDKQAAERGYTAMQSAENALVDDAKMSRDAAIQLNEYISGKIEGGVGIKQLLSSGISAEMGAGMKTEQKAAAVTALSNAYKETNSNDIKEGMKLQNEVANSQELRAQAGVNSKTEDQIKAETSKQSSLNEKVKSARTDEEAAKTSYENAQKTEQSMATNLAAAIGVNNLSGAGKKWFDGEGIKEYGAAMAAYNSGNMNEYNRITSGIRSTLNDINSSYSTVAHDTVGQVNTPTPGQATNNVNAAANAGDKATGNAHNNYDGRTDYQANKSTAETQATASQTAIAGMNEQRQADAKYTEAEAYYEKQVASFETGQNQKRPTSLTDNAMQSVFPEHKNKLLKDQELSVPEMNPFHDIGGGSDKKK